MIRKTKNKNNIIKTSKTSTFYFIGLIVAFVAMATAIFLYANQRGDSTQTDVVPDNYPSESEEQLDDSLPVELTNDSTTSTEKTDNATSNNPQTSTIKATPIITFAQQSASIVEVAGFIEGVFEDGGTCTVTFKQNTSEIVATSVAFKDASNTMCNVIKVDTSRFTKGQWSVVLNYSSAVAVGVSNERTFTVD